MFTKHLPSFQPILSRVSLLSVIALTVVSCGQAEQVKQKTPAPAVSIYEIKVNEIGSYREFLGRSVASKEVDLRARIEGELIARHFDEGSIVEKDQVLLNIEPAAYQASLESAKADLASRVAGAEGAARDLKRGREVAGDGYISQSDLDKLITNNSQAKAAVQVAESTLETAQLSLSYTVIKAPFSGRIGKVNYSIGAVVSPSSNTIATLTATDPIYVSFQVEESDYISYLQKNTHQPEDLSIDISLRLPNNTTYGEKGLLIFADTKIDQGMGTVELRAKFNNPDGIVVPGLFVTLIIEGKQKEQMALVPQVAVQESQQGKFVLVVSDDNKVVQRLVTLGRRMNAMWVVESGLKANEQVIIEGLQKVRSGVEVKPVIKSIDPLTGTISDLLIK
ncbi:MULTISPECIES: efflux RND transporter periplasmic adaptor subunit [unclassified Colwellia]|uniref:efflux RND transporter periplasmic adaptor subunit n=1 Tax=unclassified Colwellia TaxID=196834 RepID=UPI0015F4F026|nr:MULTISPECIES: efflux RND transporter periplasmic adaptor subunit [unclassified Colwellia]MBA6231714.1 efflux RND transporter periplasmic adaptor subunit [Colwellia sp. MB02u-7]MBA6235578.1 efflux RND transporter periplasmic adaptor subunit [Colwellia sp. MB02u-11]MBA6254909.1 efflux RND transporter periplasmic adaptor subunit [Colwellia sp. MB3u-28]MBA6259691.1 efflux RND transporter periplasmic adaptor subunit [Colwellia sp. MB3u-41]MBA6299566.1 efflux RND transporter periplasmic adaptor s